MNRSFLIGRISSDPHLRYTPNNKAVCEFNIAINRVGSEGTDFLTCVVWGAQAENLVKYQTKGNLIAVEGSNRVDKYQNEKGENRYKNYILVNTIEYLETKKEKNKSTIEENNTKTDSEHDIYQMFGDKIELEDSQLPF